MCLKYNDNIKLYMYSNTKIHIHIYIYCCIRLSTYIILLYLLEKLIFPRSDKKFPIFYVTPIPLPTHKICYFFLCWGRTIQPTSSVPLWLRSILTLFHLYPSLKIGLFPSGSLTKTLYNIYICIPTNCTQLIYFTNNALKHMYCLKL